MEIEIGIEEKIVTEIEIETGRDQDLEKRRDQDHDQDHDQERRSGDRALGPEMTEERGLGPETGKENDQSHVIVGKDLSPTRVVENETLYDTSSEKETEFQFQLKIRNDG